MNTSIIYLDYFKSYKRNIYNTLTMFGETLCDQLVKPKKLNRNIRS